MPAILFRTTQSVGEETTTRRGKGVPTCSKLYCGANPAFLYWDCHRKTRDNRHAYFNGRGGNGAPLLTAQRRPGTTALSSAIVCYRVERGQDQTRPLT